MSYVRKVISHREKLLCIFRPHWIYLIEGAMWLLILLALGFIVDQYFYEYIGPQIAKFKINFNIGNLQFYLPGISSIFTVIGLAVMWTFCMTYISSEIGLTDQRIIYKKGLIFIQVDQVDLEDIRAEKVFHGWIGWLLGYGRVQLDCRFIDDVWLPYIKNPYRLVKASHNARLKHPVIEYGLDEFQANIQRIEEDKVKKQKLHDIVKNRFKRVA